MNNFFLSPSARDILATGAAKWDLSLDHTQLDQFSKYAEELQRWNEQINLTRIVEETAIVTRHFLDSLRCALSWGDTPHRLIDVGSGAGFPGLPLKILYPELQLTLVESAGKKAAFLQHIVVRLRLDDVTIISARAEEVGHMIEHRESYDVAVARAVADLRVLAEYCLPLCRIGGRFLAPKGGQIEAEASTAKTAIARLGGQIYAIEPVLLPGVEPRSLVIVEKIHPTPPHYPRASGIPAKRPLS